MLAVTPHVSHTGEIILNVRPTITRVNASSTIHSRSLRPRG